MIMCYTCKRGVHTVDRHGVKPRRFTEIGNHTEWEHDRGGCNPARSRALARGVFQVHKERNCAGPAELSSICNLHEK
ncbi:hypothetical protein JTB14_016572 [Gonioctena quinquepunctata]|nr:hypothetical protein JTB14_016572 [Gonioctena quinquepunctata]